MSRYEGTVIISGCQKEVEGFTFLLNKLDEIMWDEGYVDFEGKNYEFNSDFKYEVNQEGIFEFDCPSGRYHDDLVEFLKDMTIKFDLSFNVITIGECEEDSNVLFVFNGKYLLSKNLIKIAVNENNFINMKNVDYVIDKNGKDFFIMGQYIYDINENYRIIQDSIENEIELLETLIDCEKCFMCKNLSDCYGCIDCIECDSCHECKNCYRCYNIQEYKNEDNLEGK